MWLPSLNRSNPNLSTLLRPKEVRQHKSENKILYHPGDAQKHNSFSMFNQSSSLDTLSAEVLLTTTIAILRVLSLIMFVHIHVHKCVCSSARLPGSCPGVEPQAEEKLYLYWPTCYILLWEPVMSSFMSLWWCRMDVDLTWDNTICLLLLKQNYPHCFFITHMVHLLYCNYPLLFYLAYFKRY